MNVASTAALLLSMVALQPPVFAQTDGRAQLELVIVDATNTPLANATVTVFTLDGNLGRTVTADERGTAVIAGLPVGLTQVYARAAGHRASAEGTRLKAGKNTQTVTLEAEQGDTSSGS